MKHELHPMTRRTMLIGGAGLMGLVMGGLTAYRSLAEILTGTTPRQALGPFFPDDGDEVEVIRENPDSALPISRANDQDLTFVKGRNGKANGQVITLRGRVLDARTGDPIPGALLIMWSANASGRYNHKGDDGMYSFPHPQTGEIIHRTHDEHFQYWGQAVTDREGAYWFKTIVPGFYPIDLKRGIYRPSHLHFQIMPPAQSPFVTQLYFRGDQIPNNDLNQELLPRDVVILDAGLTPAQQERVIVDYAPDSSGKVTNGLLGRYDFVIG